MHVLLLQTAHHLKTMQQTVTDTLAQSANRTAKWYSDVAE